MRLRDHGREVLRRTWAVLGEEPVRTSLQTGDPGQTYAGVQTPHERLTMVPPRTTTVVHGPDGSGVTVHVLFDRDEATAVVIGADGSMRARPARRGELTEV